MPEYLPMTVEMLAVFEGGECEWPPMMRRLMWQERAYWKDQAKKARAEYDVLQARHAALVEGADAEA